MKLHLGCGSKVFPGWTNVDILPGEGVHQDDVTTLHSIESNAYDLIYAAHVLEHISRHQVDEVLKIWASKLKPGGVLRLAVPNFEAAARLYLESEHAGDLSLITGLIVGGQRDDYDYHKCSFDERSLSQRMRQAGLCSVEHWDWRQVDHGIWDDFSQSYIPHMDKENGTLVSLNLQGRRPLADNPIDC